MRAMVLDAPRRPLRCRAMKVPTPGPGQVLIRVHACAVCRTDLHVVDGDLTEPKLPLVPGHEIVGSVATLGPGVDRFAVGDRVGVPWLGWTCGECEFCREGNENLCSRQKITGVTVDGGYAEFVKAPATHSLKIPDGLSALEAAPLFCAGLTVYRALKGAGIVPGQRLAVFGIGGLGHLAVQFGRAFGAEVTAIDISDEKLELARTFGAADALNAATTDVVKQLRRKGGVHVSLVTSAAKAAYDTAFSCLRPAGTLLVVGLPAENICFPPILMAAREVRIHASTVGTRQEMREVLAMAVAGKILCRVVKRPLAEANEALDLLRKGEVSGRIVLTP